MKYNNTIQRILAFSLLLVFAISITPKIYFHDAIANHKDDAPVCKHSVAPKACFHQKGFHCQVNDPVVSVPYVSMPVVTTLPVAYHYTAFTTAQYSFLLQRCFIHKESRGPPVV